MIEQRLDKSGAVQRRHHALRTRMEYGRSRPINLNMAQS